MLDYLLFRQMVLEIRDRVVGNWIRRVLQPDPLSLVLSFGKEKAFVIQLKPNFPNFSFDRVPEQKINSPFLLLARKHLEGRRISSFREVPGQKIVFMKAGEAQLILEMPGIRNLLILSDSQNKILGTLPYHESSLEDKRLFHKGLPYAEPEPPRFHLFLASEEELKRAWHELYSGKEKKWWGLNKLHWRVLREHDEKEALNIFLNARKSFSLKPCLICNAEDIEGVSLLEPPGAAHAKNPGSSSLCDVLSTFEKQKLNEEIRKENQKHFLSIIRQLLARKNKKLEAQSLEIKEAGNAEEFKKTGDLLLTFVKEIKKGEERFQEPLSGREISLDPRFNPVENAQAYYKRYKKAKNALVVLKREIEKLEHEIEELSELETWTLLAEDQANWIWLSKELERFGAKPAGGKRATIPAPQSCLRLSSSHGFLFLVGRNAAENVEVLHQAKKEDLWFHAKNIPGGHVVIRALGKEVTQEVIHEAASLAAFYSKGRSWDKVPVDYTLRKEVRPLPGAKAHVTYQNQKTILVQPKSF